jgi:hypothetical protein
VIVSWEHSLETCSFSGRPTHSKQVQPHKVRRKLEVEAEDSLDDNDMESAGRVVCGAGRPPNTPDRPSRPPDKGQTGID